MESVPMVVAGSTTLIPSVNQWSEEQITLIKNTVAKGCDDNELALFMYTATRTGLDPLAKQIHAVKRWNSQVQKEVMAIQTGIDGYRLIAERSKEVDGQIGPHWCGRDGVWKDVWISDEPPTACRVVVLRKGCKEGFSGVAKFKSYCQTTKEGKPVFLWAKMPEMMLAKCAEALALRKAFPQELSGIYTAEEMAQAENTVQVVDEPKQVEAPKPEAKQAAQSPTSKAAAEMTVTISQVEEKLTKNNKKYFVVHYSDPFGEGKASTFSESVANQAREMIGKECTMQYELSPDGKYKNITGTLPF